MERTVPALRQADDGWLIDCWLDDLHVTTPAPVSESEARRYARLLWDGFGVEIDGDAPWM